MTVTLPRALADANWALSCSVCRATYPAFAAIEGCPSCAAAGRRSVLEVSLPALAPAAMGGGHRGMRRFAHLLPVASAAALVSLGEGDTPLVPSRAIGPRLGLRSLWFKNETANPTWSYKDRYVAVSISVAKALGYDRVAVSSTGNLGTSVAAYAAAAGMRCVFLAPPDAPKSVLQQAAIHGAQVVVTSWEGRLPLFEHLALTRGWFPVGLFLPRRVHNPFGVEGYKTIAHELVESLGRAPAAVLFPSARGNGLFGTWKGFVEARNLRQITTLPRMVSCQPIGANSLEVSLQRGVSEPVELPQIKSIAFSTMETVADRRALAAIRESRGHALSASDDEIVAALGELAREGLFVEPSCALPVACLPRLIAAGAIDPGEPIVCVLTAAGAKWAEHVPSLGPEPVTIEPTTAALDRWLERGS